MPNAGAFFTTAHREPEPMPTYSLNVNGQARSVTVSSSGMPLLWVLRDVLNLTGTKYGCGITACGACTVMIDGEPKKTCDMDVSSAVGKAVVTIEGLSKDRSHPVQQAWIQHQVPQCGFCQPGMIMKAACALKAGHHGKEIASECDNLCVCGTYARVRNAVAGL
jgi:isoquinoline 1-oxidoreductase alpha subunit